MWPFSKKQKPIWKFVSREFIRQERQINCVGGVIDIDCMNVYAVTYVDLISGRQKITEEHELA